MSAPSPTPTTTSPPYSDHSGAVTAEDIAALVLGAVAILLVPGLFEDFRAGRLITILALIAGMGAFAIAAKRKREQITE